MNSSPTPRMLWLESLESRCLLAGGLFNASPATMPPHTLAHPDDHHSAEPSQQIGSPSHRVAAPSAHRRDHAPRDAHQGKEHHRHDDRHHHPADQRGSRRHGPSSTAMPEIQMPGPPMQATPTPQDAGSDSSSETMSMPGTGSNGLSRPGGNSSDSPASDLINTPTRDDLSAGVLTTSSPVQTDAQQTTHASIPQVMAAQPNNMASRDVVGGSGDNAGVGDQASHIRSLPDGGDAASGHDSRDVPDTNPLIDDFSLRPRAPLPAPTVAPPAEWELDEGTLDRLKAVAESQAEPDEQDANVAWDTIVATWFDGPGGLIDLNAERQPLLHPEALDQIVAIELDAGLGLHRSLGLLAAAEPVPGEDELRVAILNAIAQAARPIVAPPRAEAAARTSALTYPALVLIAGSLAAVHRRQRASKSKKVQ